jgi:hypothetical protein
MGILCGFPVTDTGQRRLHVEGKWKPFIPSCMNMLLTTHSAIVYTQSPEMDFVMSGTLVGGMAMASFKATSHESMPIVSRWHV